MAITTRKSIATLIAGLLVLVVSAISAAAVEPIKISRGDVALDLSRAVEIYRNQGQNFQVSTAPGLDGIVRRIEVEASAPRRWRRSSAITESAGRILSTPRCSGTTRRSRSGSGWGSSCAR